MAFNIKLAANSSKLHKSFTVILAVLLVALSFIDVYREEIFGYIGVLLPEYASQISAVIGSLIIVARYIHQSGLLPDTKFRPVDEE